MPKAVLDQAVREVFKVKGHTICLQESEGVFTPSVRGFFLAEHIQVLPQETVIDIGTGTGFFAILGALEGGRSNGTDISPTAIELAQKNADLNDVDIDFREGSFFADFNSHFDVVIANLPQKWILGTDRPGTNGGASGNEIITTFLQEAKKHMHRSSRLYTLVNTLSDYQETVRIMEENYKTMLLAEKDFSEDTIIREDVEAYKELNDKGTIKIFEKEGAWHSKGFCYELRLL